MAPEGLRAAQDDRHGAPQDVGGVPGIGGSGDAIPLACKGFVVRRGIRTTIPGKDGERAGDLLDRDFTAEAPNRTWVMDFTYVRTWAGFVYVAFIVDVFAQRIVAWKVNSTKAVELVDIPLRMALWQRGREGNPVVPGKLIGHADAGLAIHSDRVHRPPRR